MLELNKIYCGDCMDYMREMPDTCVDLVLTDPPYGDILKKSGWVHQPGEMIGHAKENDYTGVDFDSWDIKPTKEYFTEILRISKNQIIFGGNYFCLPESPCWIIWDKDNGNNDFADVEMAWCSFNTAARIFKWRWNGMLQQDPTHKEKREHPTQKPLPLMEWCLQKYSKPGDTVIDPFMGSGTTCVACKKLGRNYIGIEKEAAYIAIAEKRLEKVNNTKLSEWGF